VIVRGGDAGVDVRDGRGVGTVGSVGESGPRTAVPVVSLWQPVSSTPTASAPTTTPDRIAKPYDLRDGNMDTGEQIRRAAR
jgi:hypothetical protein